MLSNPATPSVSANADAMAVAGGVVADPRPVAVRPAAAVVEQPQAEIDHEAGRCEYAYALPESEWIRRGKLAIDFHDRAKTDLNRRQSWNRWTLQFPDPLAEKAFNYYFGQVRGSTMRNGLLFIAAVYMIYSVVAWEIEYFFWHLVVARCIYVFVLLGSFIATFVFEEHFRLHTQVSTTIVLSLTGIDIIVEGALQGQLYSPFFVILLLVYLVAGCVFVRVRFVQATVIGWSSLLTFDIFCAAFLPTDAVGDSSNPDPGSAWRWLLWYNLTLGFVIGAYVAFMLSVYIHIIVVVFFSKSVVLVFISISFLSDPVVLMKMTHRAEVSARYEFLTSFRLASLARTKGVGFLEESSSESIWTSAPPPPALAESSASPPPSPPPPPAAFRNITTNNRSATLLTISQQIDASSSSYVSLPPEKQPLLADEAKANTTANANATVLFFSEESSGQPLVHAVDAESRRQAVMPDYSHAQLTLPATSYSTFPPSLSSEPQLLTSSNNNTFMSSSSTAENKRRWLVQRIFDALVHPQGSGDRIPPIETVSRMLEQSGEHSFLDFVRALAAQEGSDQRPSEQKHKQVFKLLTIEELPDYFAPYAFVLTGYRVDFSWRLCWESLFRMHNETLNVWTEFVPALFSLVAVFVALNLDPVMLEASKTDRLFVALGLLGALVIRPIASGLAHLLHCQSRRAFVVWWGVDYVSICLCVLCISVCFGRWTFACLPQQQVFFAISECGLFASTIISVLFVASAAVRTGSFILFVAFAVGTPFIYQLSTKWHGGASSDVPDDYIMWWVLNSVFVALGLLVKAAMIPERFWPGKFDIIGSSHQWWHVCITAGNTFVYFAWRSYLRFRAETPC